MTIFLTINGREKSSLMTTLMTRFHWTIFLTMRPKVENNETSFLSTSEKLAKADFHIGFVQTLLY